MSGKKGFLIILVCLLVFLPLVIFAGNSKKNYKYVGSKFSINYHLPSCKKAKRIQEKNRVTFASAEEAIKAGYVPCGLCKPPTKDSPAGGAILNTPEGMSP